jgi:hypothetical protein
MFRPSRWLATVSVAAFCASVLIVGGDRASANSNCDQTNPQADLAMSETVAQLTSTDYQVHAIATDLGPCNIPDAVITIMLPALVPNSTITVATTPNSWNCAVTGNVATGAGFLVTCPNPGSSSPTIGVPGNHDFFVTFTPSSSDTTVVAVGTVGGGAACTPPTTCDPYTDNNTAIGAFLSSAGGSLTTCPSGNCSQFSSVSVQNGSGSVQIQLLQSRQDAVNTCAALTGFPSCFGKIVSITSGSTILKATKVFTIDASLAPVSFGQVQLIRSTDGTTWTVVQTCKSAPLTNSNTACVVSKTQFKVNGVTFWQFIVITLGDDAWGDT